MVDGNDIESVDGGGFPMVGWDSVIVYLYDINFSPTDGLAPCGAGDVGVFPMVRWLQNRGWLQNWGGGRRMER